MYCAQFTPGEIVDPKIGGTQAERTMIQSVGDIVVAARAAMFELTTLCLGLAGDQASTDAGLAAPQRVTEACKLAAAATQRPLVASDANCIVSEALLSACASQCVPSSAACADACNVSACAKAECFPPDGPLGPLLALRGRLQLVADASKQLRSEITAITAIRAVCIPALIVATHDALSDVDLVLEVADGVIATARGDSDAGTDGGADGGTDGAP